MASRGVFLFSYILMSAKNLVEKLVSLCKRRGFVFPGSEIYGGLANSWDYGPLGVELKNNIRDDWWRTFVRNRDDIVGLDAAILMKAKVWEASGHVAGFTDPLVDCKNCRERHRLDKLIETAHLEKKGEEIVVAGVPEARIKELMKELNIVCPSCGASAFTESRKFNLMFKTFQGVVEDETTLIYLRPETAQGIFVNFKNVLNSTSLRIPFGIAQLGKAFRNEISPGNFLFRTREFEQMEIEYFIEEKDAEIIFERWQADVMGWFLNLGVKKENLRWRRHTSEELSHYSRMTYDVDYDFPFGWAELHGLAYRTNYDLSQHIKYSGQDLRYRNELTGEEIVPHVIEPSWGLTRTFLMVLCDAYREEEVNGKVRVFLKLSPKLAPHKAAVFPLVANKPELTEKAKAVYLSLKKDFAVAWDDRGNIGRRYRSQDEIGTPWCVTIDYQTLEDETVTVRNRDTMKQERMLISDLPSHLSASLE